MTESGHTPGESVNAPAPDIGAAPLAPAAPLFAALSGMGNAAAARLMAPQSPVLARQPVAQGAPAEGPATAAASWQHVEVQSRADAIERTSKERDKPKDRGLELYMDLVPSVVRAVKGYSTADGKQIPLENAMLIISQSTTEHAPYDPTLAKGPVVPAGNMMFGVTSDSETPGATVRTRTDEVKGGKRVSEPNRKFRAYDSLDEAAMGYLRALEGSDPDAAKNPAYQSVLNALMTPGMSPQKFGATLDAAQYATTPEYGTKVAANAGEGSWASAKSLVKKFMPQIKAAQAEKIAALGAKRDAYQELVSFIEDKISDLEQQLEVQVLNEETIASLNAEIAELQADRETALKMVETIPEQIQKEQQLLGDLDDFAATLGPPRPY